MNRTAYDTEYNSLSFHWIQAEAFLIYLEARQNWVPVPVARQAYQIHKTQASFSSLLFS